MADSWIGGDPAGLQRMGSTMGKAPDELQGATRALSNDVESLVRATGWSGAAAKQFAEVWSVDSHTSGVFSTTVGDIGTTISRLGEDLAHLDYRLHYAAEDAYKAGLKLDDYGNATPVIDFPGPGPKTPPELLAAYQEYQAQSEGIRAEAQQVRNQAQSQLTDFLNQLLKDPPPKTASPDLYVSAADYLRGLLVAPDEKRRGLLTDFEAKLAKLRQAQREARSLRDARGAAGEPIRPGDPAYAPFKKAMNDVTAFEREASLARRTPAPVWARALNYKVGDFRAMSALEEAGKLPKFLKFATDVPVLDVAATAVATGLQARDDTEKGWSVQKAVAVDGGTAVVGLAAGLAAATVVGGPVLWAAGVGGAVAFGVGDLGYQAFHEHWNEDIHDHGVVVGLADGAGHSLARVGGDVKQIATDIWGGATHLWKALG